MSDTDDIAARFAMETKLLGLKLLPGQEASLLAGYTALQEMLARVGIDHPLEAEPAHVFLPLAAGDQP